MGIGRIRISTADYGILEVLPEIILRTEKMRVGEVQEREIFRKVVLNGVISTVRVERALRRVPGWVYQRE